MKLDEIIKEEDLELKGLTDTGETDRFLVRMDKKPIEESHPAVQRKVKDLNSILRNIGTTDGRYKSLKATIDKLLAWLKERPLTRVSNPAGRGVYHTP